MGDEDAQAFKKAGTVKVGQDTSLKEHRLQRNVCRGKAGSIVRWKNERLHLWNEAPYVQEDEP